MACSPRDNPSIQFGRTFHLVDIPQPRVSELLNGKISRMTADLLTKYLYRLGREVKGKTKSGGRAVAMV